MKSNMQRPIQSVCISVSPKAGSGEGRVELLRLQNLLTDAGIECQITSNIKEVRDWATQEDLQAHDGDEIDRGSKVVVAAGGDGTIALVANNTPPGIGIVPMPMGTENLLARHFGYRSQASDAWERIRLNERYVMDAGRLHPSGRLFLVMVSAGVDAEVVRAMHLTRRGHIRRWHYARHVLRAFRRYRFPPIRLTDLTEQEFGGETCHEVPDSTSCRLAMAFNLPCYAMSLPFAADADGQDGTLHVLSFQQSGSWQAFQDVVRVSRQQHLPHKGFHRSQMQRLRMESADGDRVPVQVDGDYAGRLPVEIEILPRRVTLISPRLPA